MFVLEVMKPLGLYKMSKQFDCTKEHFNATWALGDCVAGRIVYQSSFSFSKSIAMGSIQTGFILTKKPITF